MTASCGEYEGNYLRMSCTERVTHTELTKHVCGSLFRITKKVDGQGNGGERQVKE